jgi:hypothetical protein
MHSAGETCDDAESSGRRALRLPCLTSKSTLRWRVESPPLPLPVPPVISGTSSSTHLPFDLYPVSSHTCVGCQHINHVTDSEELTSSCL